MKTYILTYTDSLAPWTIRTTEIDATNTIEALNKFHDKVRREFQGRACAVVWKHVLKQ